MQQKSIYPSQNHMGMGRKSHGYGNCTDEATWNMETEAQLQSHNFPDDSYSTDNISYHNQQFAGGMPMKHGGAYATEHSEHSMSKHHGMPMKHGGAYATEHSEHSMSKHHGLGGMPMKHGGAYATEHSEHSMSKHHGLGGKLGVGGGGNHDMFDSMSGSHGHGHGLGNGYGHGHGHGHGYGQAHGGGQRYPFGGTNGNSGHRFSSVGGMFNNHGGGHKDYVAEEYEYEAHNLDHSGGVTAKMDAKRYERHVGGGDAYYANPYGYNRMPHGYGHVGQKVEWTAKGV